jgi:ribokinase
MFDIISIGAGTVDIFVKSNELVLKDNFLEITASSKNEISESLICSGGGATNTSTSFARLGLKSACASLVGNDPLSLFIVNDLKANHVDSSLIVQDDNNTDFSVVLVGSDGSRSILTNRGKSTLSENNLVWDKVSQTEWFYITSLEGNLDLLEKLIGFAQERSIKVALNPGNRELSDPSHLQPLLSHVDFLLLNKTESETLVGISISDEKFWDKLATFGAKISAVTNGREGAYVLSSTGKLFSPIINTNPVDETGAGDAFGSAFVAGQFYHLSLQDSLFWGIKNSASVVSALGAKPGLLTLERIKQK